MINNKIHNTTKITLFQKKTEIYNRLLFSYNIFAILSRICDICSPCASSTASLFLIRVSDILLAKSTSEKFEIFIKLCNPIVANTTFFCMCISWKI